MNHKISALLVANKNVLQASGGGVQVCNREYVASLEAADFRLRPIAYDFRNSIIARIQNRLFPKVTSTPKPRELFGTIESAVRESDAQFIFYGKDVVRGLPRKLRQAFPNLRQVLLSHGVESIDFCLEQQIRRRTGIENRYRVIAERMLGRELLEEAEQRRWIDAVLTLSPLEVEIEKWLGSRKVLWIPRTIMESKLESRPVDQRVGCVSTLDHPPNADGLVQLFDALENKVSPGFRCRLVGQPVRKGQALAERYDFVEYLGPLSDPQLRSEAATWCCFVHPMFVYAKGCSTKLAVGLGWGLPIATTEFGARGYLWGKQRLPLAESPGELAQLVLQRSTASQFEEYQRETRSILALTPGLAAVGAQIRSFLRD